MNADDAKTVQTDADGKNRRKTAAAICNGGGGDDFAFTVSAAMLSAGLMSAAAFAVRPVALRPAGPTIEIRRYYWRTIDDDCTGPACLRRNSYAVNSFSD